MSDREAYIKKARQALGFIQESDEFSTLLTGRVADALQRERQAELDACIETVQRIVWGWGWETQREKGDQLIGVLQRRKR